MTKAELIKKLQYFPCPDHWEVKILMNQWIPGATPFEQIFSIDKVSVYDEGEITIEFTSNDLPG